jgi:hypothetical protein
VKSILLMLLVSTSFADDSWKNHLQRENGTHYFYLGISSPQFSKRAALDNAYDEALKELIKNNFGFKFNYLYQQDSDLENVQGSAKSLHYRSGIKLNKVKTIKYEVEDNNGTFVAYRLISYPKSEARREKRRIASVKEQKFELRPTRLKKKKQKHQGIYFDWKINPILQYDDLQLSSLAPINGEFIFANKVGLGLWMGNYTEEIDSENKLILTRVSMFMNYYPISYYRFQMGIGLHSITDRFEIINGDGETIAKDDENRSYLSPSLTLRYQFQKNEDGYMGLEATAFETENRTNVTFGLTLGF